jgi:hypothetical protein
MVEFYALVIYINYPSSVLGALISIYIMVMGLYMIIIAFCGLWRLINQKG